MWRHSVQSKMLQPNRQKSAPSNRWNPLLFERFIQEEASRTSSQGEGKASSTENGFRETHLTNMWRQLVQPKMLQPNRQESAPRNRWNPLHFEWLIQEEASHTFSQGEGKANSTENGRQELHLTNMWRHLVRSKMLQPNRQKSAPRNRWKSLLFEWFIQEEASRTSPQGEGKPSINRRAFIAQQTPIVMRNSVLSAVVQKNIPNRKKNSEQSTLFMTEYEHSMKDTINRTDHSANESRVATNVFRKMNSPTHQEDFGKNPVQMDFYKPNKENNHSVRTQKVSKKILESHKVMNKINDKGVISASDININQIVERVYAKLDKKIKFEQQRRGL